MGSSDNARQLMAETERGLMMFTHPAEVWFRASARYHKYRSWTALFANGRPHMEAGHHKHAFEWGFTCSRVRVWEATRSSVESRLSPFKKPWLILLNHPVFSSPHHSYAAPTFSFKLYPRQDSIIWMYRIQRYLFTSVHLWLNKPCRALCSDVSSPTRLIWKCW